MFKILASEPVTVNSAALAWWGAWTVLLVTLIVFHV
jgi:hypothetical protein